MYSAKISTFTVSQDNYRFCFVLVEDKILSLGMETIESDQLQQ